MSAWLIVASGQDTPAHWACRRLRARGNRCDLLLTEALQDADVRWLHRVGQQGASVEIGLPDGRCFRSGRYAAVLNRAMTPPLTPMALADGPDSVYARSEQVAFALSWLHALAPVVVNRPTSRGMSGAWRSPLEWRVMAHAAGLQVAPLSHDSDDHHAAGSFPMTPPDGLVIGDHVFGVAAQPDLQAAARRLSRSAATPLLGLWFTHDLLTMATPNPDLTLGGEAAITALEALLRR